MNLRAYLCIALLATLGAVASPGAASSTRQAAAPTPPPAKAARHHAMAEAVNRYRESRGLARIPVSASLTRVAEAHLADLEAHYRGGGQCNMHSWSPRGNWSPCCYTPDHAQAACMWRKPLELTRGRYPAPGYEIVAHSSAGITPALALEIWQDSPGHRAMMLNRGSWADNRWQAVGAALGRHYAVVWFGESAEPAGG